jgi:hypothetical protein
MFEKITKERFRRKISKGTANVFSVMCPEEGFNEEIELYNFSQTHEKSRGGHIIVHDEVGRTKKSIYLWKTFA